MKQVITLLECIASACDVNSNPHFISEMFGCEVCNGGDLLVKTRWESTNLTIRIEPNSEMIREKIATLKRNANAVNRSLGVDRSVFPMAPTGRGKFNQKIYDRFIADGESENAEEYKLLWVS